MRRVDVAGVDHLPRRDVVPETEALGKTALAAVANARARTGGNRLCHVIWHLDRRRVS